MVRGCGVRPELAEKESEEKKFYQPKTHVPALPPVLAAVASPGRRERRKPKMRLRPTGSTLSPALTAQSAQAALSSGMPAVAATPKQWHAKIDDKHANMRRRYTC